MPDLGTCAVCEAPFEAARIRRECDECQRPFHLNLRTDIEAASCGGAYIGAACGMSVYCDPCGARLEAAAAGSGAALSRVA